MSTPTVFAVIGCHRHDPEALLLQGDDGLHYVWTSPSSEPALIHGDRSSTDWSATWSFDHRDDSDGDLSSPTGSRR